MFQAIIEGVTLKTAFKGIYWPLLLLGVPALWVMWARVGWPSVRAGGFWNSLFGLGATVGITGVVWEAVLYGTVRWGGASYAHLDKAWELVLPPKLGYVFCVCAILASTAEPGRKAKRFAIIASAASAFWIAGILVQI